MICKLGQEYTRDFLERYDTYLMETRNKEAYRNKGKKKTTVNTVYGEVKYERRIYQVTREDGLTEFVFLLDEQLEISEVRIMNADGAEWGKNICDADTVFQLDPFHRNKAIKENVLNILAVRNRKSGNQSSGIRKSSFLCLITVPFLWGYLSRPCRICGA